MPSPEHPPTPRFPVIRRGWLRVLLFIPTLILAERLMAILFTGWSAMSAPPGSEPFGHWLFSVFFAVSPSIDLAFQTTVFIGSVCTVLVFRRLIDRRSFKSLGLSCDGVKRRFVWGCILGAASIALGFAVLAGFGSIAVTPRTLGPGPAVLTADLALFVIVAVGEELIMRGYVLWNLAASMGWPAAIAVSSVAFVLAHVFNDHLSAIGMVNIGLSGIALGLYVYHFRNLWFPIGFHLAWNFIQGPILGFNVSGFSTQSAIDHTLIGPDWLTGGSFGFEGSVVATGFEIAIIAGIHLTGIRMRRSDVSYFSTG